jgi:hypothetical protein
MCELRFAHTTVSDGQRAFACASVANWLGPIGVPCEGEAAPAVGDGIGLTGGAVVVGGAPGAADVGGVGMGAAVRAGGGAAGAAVGWVGAPPARHWST